MRVLEGEQGEKGAKRIFEEIVVKNSPKLMKDMTPPPKKITCQ